MPRSTHIPTGIPARLPARLLEPETRMQVRAAFSDETFDRSYRVSAEFRPEPGIMQWLIAQLPWGHITRVLVRIKGWPMRYWRQGVLLGRSDSGANS